MTDIEPVDWRARLNEQMDAYRAQQAKRKAERADHQQRRTYGKAAHHAAKLARLATNRRDDVPANERSDQ